MTRDEWLAIVERDASYTDSDLLNTARMNRLWGAIDRRALIAVIRELVKHEQDTVSLARGAVALHRGKCGCEACYNFVDMDSDVPYYLEPFVEQPVNGKCEG